MNYYKELYNPFEVLKPYIEDLASAGRMSTDIKDYKDHYEVDIEVPGIKKEEINISFEDGTLTVSVDQKEVEDKDTYLRKERFITSCSREFYLGEDVDENNIDASLNDGVLHLDIKKLEPVKQEKKQIIIK